MAAVDDGQVDDSPDEGLFRRRLHVGIWFAAAAGLAWFVRIRVVREQLDLVTFVALVAAGATGLVAVGEVALRSARFRLGLAVSIVATAAMLVVVELGLRAWPGSYATYLERNEGRSYELQYHHTGPARYHVFSPNTSYTHPRQEFAFPRTTNSMGLADREIPFDKASGEYRIVAFGDSYTEGVGAAYEDTWLAVAARRIAAAMPGRTVTSFNAGISGSDPWYAFILFAEKLAQYEPDLVFLAINASDVNDVIIRGGAERFQLDGSVRPRPTPWWEWLYGVSYLVRHVMHDVAGYNSLFVKTADWPEERKRATGELMQAINSFRRLTDGFGIRLVVVFHPDKQEAARQRYERAFAAFVEDVKGVPGLEVVDVLDRWKAKGLLQDTSELFWPIDGHNTPKGYAAFGEVVAEAVRP
jgi:lysophospholipase L1-like esterase